MWVFRDSARRVRVLQLLNAKREDGNVLKRVGRFVFALDINIVDDVGKGGVRQRGCLHVETTWRVVLDI